MALLLPSLVHPDQSGRIAPNIDCAAVHENLRGDDMEPFREKAFYLLVWRAFLASLIALVLIVTCSHRIAGAFVIGANVALVFSLSLIVWARQLTDERIVSTEAWRILKPSQRPAGIGGRRCACLYLNEVALRFAKASSAVAAGLCASALIFASEPFSLFRGARPQF